MFFNTSTAVLAVCSIGLSYYIYRANSKLNRMQGKFEESHQSVMKSIAQQKLEVDQKLSEVSIKPYFFLNLEDAPRMDQSHNLIFPITMINVGKEAAVQVHLISYENGVWAKSISHMQCQVREYLNRNYASPNAIINFELIGVGDVEPGDTISFQIGFQDLADRQYFQEFKVWLYRGNFTNRISVSNPEILKEHEERY